METKTAVLRVSQDPFVITGRGLAVVCELTEGDCYYAVLARVRIPNGTTGDDVEAVAHVELAVDGSARPWREKPALLFPLSDDDLDSLRSLLGAGTSVVIETPADATQSVRPV